MNLPSDPLLRYNHFRTHPWEFLKHCVYTSDEVDKKNPIKQFPSHLTYLYFLVKAWQREDKIAVPKSRRMTASWTFIALTLWDYMFHKGRSWACVSKKEEDSKELVARALFIYRHIPPTMISPELLPKLKRDDMQASPPVMEAEEIHSKIQGFPSGGNQLRQRGFSGLLFDECSFWEDAEEAFASAAPTIQGGGKIIMISSRATEDGGFFKKVVYDQLDSLDTRFPEVPPVPASTPMEGVTVWKNPKNGFFVVDLHYTANPEKRSAEFREAVRASMPIRRYRMEYEKNWETFEGKSVYEDFNEQLHLTPSRPQMHVGLPLLLGWDSSGLTPAVIIAQMQEDRLVIFREIIGDGMGAVRFVPMIKEQLNLLYGINEPATQVISFFDPAGFKRNEITEQTYLQTMNKEGFTQTRQGAMTWNARVDSVTEWLVGLSGGKGKLQIYAPDCPVLVAGFKGGYRYPESTIEVEPDKGRAVKDGHSHPHDALQYLCSGFKSFKRTHYNIIPTSTYGFQKGTQTKDPSTSIQIGRKDKYGKLFNPNR